MESHTPVYEDISSWLVSFYHGIRLI